ncbi:hypothetical protein LSH36_414g00053 [Paralvinella palmiformis]|uniref:Uncharacterized protein n=1 Tax=Paralvinella palmiformis TaxID=53620 RepID=A0AAD9JCD3_9ANNE|nr:hypothetical protein LSH36_414g00053 [Paralvinella palmiformis]
MVASAENHVTDEMVRYSSAFARKLEDELSGSTERGITIPMIRIPGKTHLSSVLLMNNPWADRDLDRKLDYIEKERERRQKVLDWNQRHFFASQIFDPECRLRFTAKRREFAGQPEAEPTYGNMACKTMPKNTHTRTKVKVGENDSDDDAEVEYGGIFAKPLEWNLPHRNHRKATVRTKGKSGHPPKRGYVTDRPEADRGGSVKPRRDQPRSLTAEQQGGRKRAPPKLALPDIGSTFKTEIPRDGDITSSPEPDAKMRGPFLVRKLSAELSDLEEVASSGSSDPDQFVSTLHRSLTLPQIDRRGDVDVDWSRDDGSSDAEGPVAPPRDSICDQGLITKLTKTLPTALLIKANSSVNKMVAMRKTRMLEKCRQICGRDLFKDPRWRALKETLVTTDGNSLSSE